MLNLSRLVPEARPVVQAAAGVYLRHTAPWFVGLIAHGSALKGGFIPGGSDIDLQLYLEDSAFGEGEQLPLALCLAIQRDLAQIDPAPFRYIQCNAHPRTPPTDALVGPVPGAYAVIAGRLPWPEATADEILAAAQKALAGLDPLPAFVTAGLLEHGGGRLAAQVRLLSTKVWPVLLQVLVLETGEPLRVWALPKDEAIRLLPAESPCGGAIRAFYQAMLAYYDSFRQKANE